MDKKHIKIKTNPDVSNDEIAIVIKDQQFKQKFVNYYIYYNILNRMFIDESSKINLMLLKKVEIPLLRIQDIIINFYDTNKKIVEYHEELIESYKIINNNFIKLLDKENKIKLTKQIQFINPENDVLITHETIVIYRNGSKAGTVEYHDSPIELSQNCYYSEISKNTKLIYFLLKCQEDSIREKARINNQANVTKTIIESLEIPDISNEIKNNIINNCNLNFENIKYSQSIIDKIYNTKFEETFRLLL
jgi:hypothetical protein